MNTFKSEMKKVAPIALLMLLLGVYTSSVSAQDATVNNKYLLLDEEEEGPLMYKFEPEFLTSLEVRKAKIKKMRAILDTLDIREGKRKRLLKDLYKNGISERLSKALLADTDFEEVEELIN